MGYHTMGLNIQQCKGSHLDTNESATRVDYLTTLHYKQTYCHQLLIFSNPNARVTNCLNR